MVHDESEQARAEPLRRSLAIAGITVAALLIAITIPLIVGGDDTTFTAATADDSVGPRSEGSDTTEAATTTTTDPEGGPGGLVVTPSSGLQAGDRVEFRSTPPGSGTTIAAQCAREVVDRNLTGTEPLSWCRGVSYGADPYPLRRVVPTTAGRVDCTEEAGRCVLAVRFGGPGGTDNRWAPLSFAPAGPIPEPEVRIKRRTDGATIADGAEIRLKISGFTPGSPVRVSQCRAPEPLGFGIQAKGPGPGTTPEDCDLSPATPDEPLAVGPDGTLTVSRTVWAEIFTSVGWVGCEPCELRVSGTGPGIDTTATVALSVEDTAAPQRPELEIVTPGPHRPGQTVEVRGSGFRHSGSLSLHVCPISKDGAIRRSEACHTPPTQSLPVTENGAIAGEIRLPGAEHALAQACTTEPGVCGFGPPGTPPHPFFVPFDISG